MRPDMLAHRGDGDREAPAGMALEHGPDLLRASDADREEATDRLERAWTEGRLDQAELEARAGRVHEGRTLGDLRALVRDLPAGPAPASLVRPEAPPGAVRHPAPAPAPAPSRGGMWAAVAATSFAVLVAAAMIAAVAGDGDGSGPAPVADPRPRPAGDRYDPPAARLTRVAVGERAVDAGLGLRVLGVSRKATLRKDGFGDGTLRAGRGRTFLVADLEVDGEDGGARDPFCGSVGRLDGATTDEPLDETYQLAGNDWVCKGLTVGREDRKRVRLAFRVLRSDRPTALVVYNREEDDDTFGEFTRVSVDLR